VPLVPCARDHLLSSMSPTVLRAGGYRFFFFSREETRMHVHVYHDEGEAKYWLEPALELAASTGLSQRRLAKVRRLIEENEDAIRKAWTRHFGH
jgi:hypothetical protein